MRRIAVLLSGAAGNLQAENGAADLKNPFNPRRWYVEANNKNGLVTNVGGPPMLAGNLRVNFKVTGTDVRRDLACGEKSTDKWNSSCPLLFSWSPQVIAEWRA